MFASITCPACRHKYTIPEGAMGNRQTCPNCQSPFLAGKSAPEADVPMQFKPGAATAPAAINKTMLGETEPPIRYNCPRCKKPLESPAIEAGTKKPCPGCGQRLQVPAAPPGAPTPNLNKTMLVNDDGRGQPHAVAAGAPPMHAPAGGPAGGPGDATRPGPKLSPRMLAIGGAAAGVVLLLLLSCLIAMLFSGPSSAERERMAKAKQDYDNAQRELQELKKSIQDREAAMAQQKELELKHQRQMETLQAENKSRQDKLDLQYQLDRLAAKGDEQKAVAAKAIYDQQQRDLEAARVAALKRQHDSEAELKSKLAALEADLRNEKTRAATIIQQPAPPVYVYPPYNPWRYWPGW